MWTVDSQQYALRRRWAGAGQSDQLRLARRSQDYCRYQCRAMELLTRTLHTVGASQAQRDSQTLPCWPKRRQPLQIKGRNLESCVCRRCRWWLIAWFKCSVAVNSVKVVWHASHWKASWQLFVFQSLCHALVSIVARHTWPIVELE